MSKSSLDDELAALVHTHTQRLLNVLLNQLIQIMRKKILGFFHDRSRQALGTIQNFNTFRY